MKAADILTGADRVEAVRSRIKAGFTMNQVAVDTGLHFSTVRRCMADNDIPEPGRMRPARTWRDAIQDMTPAEAVEHLSHLLEEITWAPPMGREPVPGVRLRPLECKMLRVLHAAGGNVVTRGAMLSAMYDDRQGDSAAERTPDVYVCHLRRKLSGAGVKIVTHWGEGWSLRLAEGVTLWGRA